MKEDEREDSYPARQVRVKTGRASSRYINKMLVLQYLYCTGRPHYRRRRHHTRYQPPHQNRLGMF